MGRPLPRTAVSVLIPFASDCGDRRRALSWVLDQLHNQHAGWQVVVGQCTHPWRKADAVEDAARRADGDVYVIHDADVWCDHTDQAVAVVTDGASWSMPHGWVHRLDELATRDVIVGRHPGTTTGRADRARHGVNGGGIVVVPRAVWRDIPMDPRFEGWGQEDMSWAAALRCLAGTGQRLDHDLWHLWHPPAERRDRRIGSTSSEQLFFRYHRARNRPGVMTEIIQEVHDARLVRHPH